MRRFRWIAISILTLLSVLWIAGTYLQARAQRDVVAYLQERYREAGVPFVSIRRTRDVPLAVEVTVRTVGNREHSSPEEPIYEHVVEREIDLAQQHGYFIQSYAIRFVDSSGKQLEEITAGASPLEFLWLDNSPARIGDSDTQRLLADGLALDGMSLTDLEVASAHGLQSVLLRLGAPSMQAANAALPRFMPSVRMLLDQVNAQGAHIVSLHIELKDRDGAFLLNYIIDLRVHQENWWMADGVNGDWFPQPSP